MIWNSEHGHLSHTHRGASGLDGDEEVWCHTREDGLAWEHTQKNKKGRKKQKREHWKYTRLIISQMLLLFECQTQDIQSKQQCRSHCTAT